MKLAFVLLFALVCSVSCQWTDSSWTDTDFGGVMYLCFDDDEVHGAYTEYGIVVGTRSGDEVEGWWYEPGGNSESCLNGPFGWTISDNGNSFTGWWSCVEDDEEFDWNETRIGGSDTTNDQNCAVLAHDDDFAGSFVDSVNNLDFDACVDDDEYYASYHYDSPAIPGYETGVVYTGDHGEVVGSGVWIEEDISGVSLVFRLRNGDLGNFWWEYDDDGEINTFTDFDTLHEYDVYDNVGDADDNDCSENEFLLTNADDDDDNDDDNADDDDDNDDDNADDDDDNDDDNADDDDDNDDDNADDDDDNDDDNADDDNADDDDTSSDASIVAATCLFVIILAFI